MEEWVYKGNRVIVPGSDIIWNPRLALYLTVSRKAISAYRAIDGQQILSFKFKNTEENVIQCEWEPSEGKMFAVFFQNGAVKIYDGSSVGKVQGVLNLNPSDRQCDIKYGMWTPMRWVSFEPELDLLDVDLSELMPRLVKIVTGSKNLEILEYEGASPTWRFQDHRNLSHLFLAHDRKNSRILVSIDALLEIDFEIGVRDVFKVVPVENNSGHLLCVGRDASLQHVHLNFFNCALTRKLIVTSGKLRFLAQYFTENMSLIQSELIDPYATFMRRLVDAYDDKDLVRDLRDVLFTGAVTPALEDWLCHTIGDKNLRRWQQLSERLYSETNKIIVLALIPALEQLTVSAERFHGLVKALRLLKFGLSHAGASGVVSGGSAATLQASEALELIATCRDALTFTFSLVSELNLHANFRVPFAAWFHDTVSIALDEDYTRKAAPVLTPRKILHFLSNSFTSTALFDRCDSQLKSLAQTLDANVQVLYENYTRRWTLAQITVSEPIQLREEAPSMVFDVQMTPMSDLMLLCTNSGHSELNIISHAISRANSTMKLRSSQYVRTIPPLLEGTSGKTESRELFTDAKFSPDEPAVLALHGDSKLTSTTLNYTIDGSVRITSPRKSTLEPAQGISSIRFSQHHLLALVSDRNAELRLFEYHMI
ncbi:LAMI_0H15742g1_1 [Lachancea mirantina]|uniref:Anaphase-promoting complex subunit 4 n=1 Tax=Lachancea mirantina TaxID=1230905 RepID=A0A1G4KIK9_9SACH|nr:LAMI_0H15742g1_1 [Lachancea mirantina]